MMSRRILFLVSLVGLGCAVSAADDASEVEDNPLLRPPAPEVSKEQILEAYGYVLGRDFSERLQLFPMFYSFGFTDQDFDVVMRGISAAFKGQDEPVDMDVVGPQLRDFIDNRPEEVRQTRLAAGQAEQKAALEQLDAREEIKQTESGLRYDIKTPGTGEKPKSNSTVLAHYRGSFVDGTEFDSSVAFGQPARFSLNKVIPAWQEGLQLIGAGGRIILFAPSELAYGDYGRAPIPPGKMLIFDVELISVGPPEAEAPAPAPSDAAGADSADAATAPATP